MQNETFMFTTAMLSDMTGSNRQYISKKIKRLIHDPTIQLKAILKSNKEGYQISEEEVLRCFHGVTPGMIKEYKEYYLSMGFMPHVKKLTEKKRKSEESIDIQRANELLVEWKVKLAATAPDKKNSLEIRYFLENEIVKIEELKREKMREFAMLELLISNCDKMVNEIQQRLDVLQKKSK